MRELIFKGSLYGFITEMVLWAALAFVLSFVTAKMNKTGFNAAISLALSLIFFFIIAFNFSFEEPSSNDDTQTSSVSVQ